MTVARMKSAQSGFDEVGKAYVWKALVGAVAFGLVATAYAMPVAVQQTAAPPGAATIERQRVAANRPYDEARKTILAQVRKTAWQGPMQPEWQSLTADSTPERYRDAKFGIFIAESDRGDLTGDRQARAFQAAARWPLICRHSRRACMPMPIASAWMRVGRMGEQLRMTSLADGAEKNR